VYTVFSTKGGVGKTLFHKQRLLAKKRMPGSITRFGSRFWQCRIGLESASKVTISDVVDDIRNIDGDLIESYLMP
jgi:pilus assembly protein CpaE